VLSGMTLFQSAARIVASLTQFDDLHIRRPDRFQSAARIVASLTAPGLRRRPMPTGVSIRRADRCLTDLDAIRDRFARMPGFNPPRGSLPH